MKRIIFLLILLMGFSLMAFNQPISPKWKKQNSDSTRYFIKGNDSLFATMGGMSYKKFYNVKHFGAVGDSTTDDRAAILAAIDAYRQSGGDKGATIYFPAGTYRISNPIVIYIDTFPRIAFVGEGYATKIVTSGVGGFSFYGMAGGKTGITIKDMAIFNEVGNTTSEYLLRLRRLSLYSIQNVWLQGQGYSTYGIYLEGAQQGYIKGGYINTCVNGIKFQRTTADSGNINSNGVHVSGVTITGTSLAGLYTRGVWYNGAQTGTFIGNHVTNCTTLVQIDSASEGLSIISNQLETGVTGILSNLSSKLWVEGNAIYNCDVSVYFKDGNNNTFNGNLCNDSVIFGAGSNRNTIMSNLFSGAVVIDSNTASPDNLNNWAFNTSQGGGSGYTEGFQMRSGSTDTIDFLLNSAGNVKFNIEGQDSAFYKVIARGTPGTHGYDFGTGPFARIYTTNNTTSGIVLATNNTSNVLTDRFRIAGFGTNVDATFSNISSLIIGDYALPVIDGSNTQVLKTDGSGVVTWQDESGAGGGGLWETKGTNDTLMYVDGTDTLFYFFIDGGWVGGREGKFVTDSVLVNNYIDFGFLDGGAVHEEGRLSYDSASHSHIVYNEIPELSGNMMRENWTRVKNVSGVTIFDGKAVYFSGGTGDLPEITLAKADDTATAYVEGLATHDILTDSIGYITVTGEVKGINVNVSNFAAGNKIFLSEDTAGSWVTLQPEICIPIGSVERAHAVNGIILVSLNHSLIDTATVFGLDSHVRARINDSMAVSMRNDGDTVTGDYRFVGDIHLTGEDGFVTFNIDSTLEAAYGLLFVKDASGERASFVYWINEYFKLDDSLSMDGKGIFNLIDPINATDAATKNYVDTFVNTFVGDYIDTTTLDTILHAWVSDTSHLVHLAVRNSSGATITKGTPVFNDGYNVGTNEILIGVASASSLDSMPAVGVLDADLANNTSGNTIQVGVLVGLKTDSADWDDGDALYVGEGASGLTHIKPTNGNVIQKLGNITRSNPTVGSILISGANRVNDLPNMITDQIWIGDTDSTALLINLDSTINVKINESLKHLRWVITNPNIFFDTDSLFCPYPVIEADITITNIDVTCNIDPDTEPVMSLRFADNFISRTTPTTIDVITTTNGVTAISSGFDDATVPANNCIYFVFTADPDVAIKSMTFDITYTID